MFEEFAKNISEGYLGSSVVNHSRKHLYTIHQAALSRKNPIILELGVQNGNSTKLFLNALHRNEGGKLVSVDIEDCSHVADSSLWQFVQSDSADIDHIITVAPLIQEGIDVLYIDSLHHVDHVRKELFGFFPYVKNGGVILFDDVDSIPYMQGREKDNIHTEMGNREILNFIHETFEDNIDKLYFTFERGSTGLAILQKCAPLGVELSSKPTLRARNNKLLWKYRRSIQKRLSALGFARRP